MAADEQPAKRSPVSLDFGLCKACGSCMALCPEKVYDRDELGYPVVARADDCTQCLICELHCPDFAIEIERRAPKAKTAVAVGAAQVSAAPVAAPSSNGIVDAEDKEGLT